MKRIAIIAYGHPESTLPLLKYLVQEGVVVDYYYISYLGSKSVSGFSFGKILKRPCISELSSKRIHNIYSYLNNKNATVYLIGLLPSDYMGFLNKVIIKITGKIISRKKYDIINFVGHQPLLYYLHRATEDEAKIHTLHEVIDHFSGKNKYNALLDYLFQKKIRIIVHSKATLRQIIKQANCEKELVSIVPFGLFETYKLFDDGLSIKEDGTDYILFYGSIRPYKGLKILYEAVDILKKDHPNLKFKVIIAGSGNIPELERLENDKTYVIKNKYISNKEVVELNKLARIIVCPYLSASQSGIVMTTFLFGKPVIASDVGAFSEVIKDMYNGLLIKPDSPKELSNAISRLLMDAVLYNELSINVLKFNELPGFHWRQIAKTTLNVYFSEERI